jgi:hypothetical protein
VEQALVISAAFYMMPIASTKNVNTKGSNRVNHGQCVAMAKAVRATEPKNNNQYNPLFLLLISIAKISAKIGEEDKTENGNFLHIRLLVLDRKLFLFSPPCNSDTTF